MAAKKQPKTLEAAVKADMKKTPVVTPGKTAREKFLEASLEHRRRGDITRSIDHSSLDNLQRIRDEIRAEDAAKAKAVKASKSGFAQHLGRAPKKGKGK